MCGGSGTRVWPESRESLPKQFIPLVGAQSTFQMAMDVLADDIFETPVVISNHTYRFMLGEQLLKMNRLAHIVLEPAGRDSGPAVAVATAIAMRMAPDTIVAVLAADHVVRDKQGFVALCREAAKAAAEGYIVTLGIKPDNPAIGYGYIKPGAPVLEGHDIMKLERFVEKPDRATAERYVSEGYLWNSGNFFFRADVMQAELAAFEPAMIEAATEAVRPGPLRPRLHPSRSRRLRPCAQEVDRLRGHGKDHQGGGRARRYRLVRRRQLDGGLGAVGSRPATAIRSAGHGALVHAKNVHIRSEDHLTTVVGVDNVIVVTTQDAVLVVHRDHGDKVKQLVEKLRHQGRKEALEHKRSYRPWGYYQSIDSGARYQVKRIVVKPGAALSLQKHFHRAEHWVVVKGHCRGHARQRDRARARERVDLPAHRDGPPDDQSRQDRPRVDRGPDRLLSRRGRHHPHRGRLQQTVSERFRRTLCPAGP